MTENRANDTFLNTLIMLLFYCGEFLLFSRLGTLKHRVVVIFSRIFLS